MQDEYFSIELKITDRENPLVQVFLGEFTEAMAKATSTITGLPEVEVVACGWDPRCGSVTRADILEAALLEMGEDVKDIINEGLEQLEDEAHDR